MKRTAFCFVALACFISGCSNEAKIVIPNTPFTPQQIREIQNEDARVTNEESYGTTQAVIVESAPPAEATFNTGERD